MSCVIQPYDWHKRQGDSQRPALWQSIRQRKPDRSATEEGMDAKANAACRSAGSRMAQYQSLRFHPDLEGRVAAEAATAGIHKPGIDEEAGFAPPVA
jgi:hypothetical protein